MRCVLVTPRAEDETLYQERVTLWRSDSQEEAMRRAEADAEEYVTLMGDMSYSGFAQLYVLADEPEDGAEIFALVRSSKLGTTDYLSRFFDTGDERQTLL